MSVFFLRGIASALIAYSTRALPSTRATWGAAMENELEHIESDLEALRWAAGCIAAAYLQRSAERSFGAILKKPSAFLPVAISSSEIMMSSQRYARVVKIVLAIPLLAIAGISVFVLLIWVDHFRETTLPAPTSWMSLGSAPSAIRPVALRPCSSATMIPGARRASTWTAPPSEPWFARACRSPSYS